MVDKTRGVCVRIFLTNSKLRKNENKLETEIQSFLVSEKKSQEEEKECVMFFSSSISAASFRK